MEAADHPIVALVSGETARRLEDAACRERPELGELERLATEMEGYLGVPGPMLAMGVHAGQVLDLEGRILYVSPKAAEMTGLSESVMRGRKPTDSLPLTAFLSQAHADDGACPGL